MNDEQREMIDYAAVVFAARFGSHRAPEAQEKREYQIHYPRRISVLQGRSMPMPCGPTIWGPPTQSSTVPATVTFDFSRD